MGRVDRDGVANGAVDNEVASCRDLPGEDRRSSLTSVLGQWLALAAQAGGAPIRVPVYEDQELSLGQASEGPRATPGAMGQREFVDDPYQASFGARRAAKVNVPASPAFPSQSRRL